MGVLVAVDAAVCVAVAVALVWPMLWLLLFGAVLLLLCRLLSRSR